MPPAPSRRVLLSRRIKAFLRSIVTWAPLNRVLTDVLRKVLPERDRHRPGLPRLAPRTGVVEAQLPDGRVLKVASRGDDAIASDLFWRGWAAHEPETSTVFYELAASARVTLDIGAHIGYYALLASHANPAGRVYAFEPLEPVHKRLQSNVLLNEAGNVTCVPLAVGSSAGTAEFFHESKGMPSTSSFSQSFIYSHISSDQITSSVVEVVEADTFVEEHEIVGIDLVKIDTETSEAAVFRGMAATLRRDRPTIICEILDGEVAEAIEAIVKPLDYTFFLMTPDGLAPRDSLRPDERWRNFIFRPARP